MYHFKLRDYQKKIIKTILDELKNGEKKMCVSLATGGGKTVIFSELINYLDGSILILVHREELVLQTSNTLTVEHESLTQKIKKLKGKKILVSMVQTFSRRKIDINSFDYVIVDECHRGDFMKVIKSYKGNLIGFTATPNYEKKEVSIINGDKYRENIPLSSYYGKLIHGIEIDELISLRYLCPEEHYSLDVDTSRLVWDDFRQEYTDESVSLVFGSEEALENTLQTYLKLAKGKKTMVFNPNTLVNKKLYKKMFAAGLNVKMYDSVNSDLSRLELVEWFRKERDAILLNVQVFTTGFDVTDVEVIFLNKHTHSINLYLQMVGRGARITNNIFKPSFLVIDMGNNLSKHGYWSDKRSWNDYFYNNEKKIIGKPKPANTRVCHNCNAVVAANSLICPYCSAEKKQTINGVVGLPKLNGKPIIPDPKKIIEYCMDNNLTTLIAKKIIADYVVKMFDEVSYDSFLNHKENGNLYFRTKKFLTPYYFSIIKSDLEGNKKIKLETFINHNIAKIERKYTAS